MPTKLTRSGRRHPVIEIHWNGKIEARPRESEHAGVKNSTTMEHSTGQGKGQHKSPERQFSNNLKTIPPTVPLSYAETLRA